MGRLIAGMLVAILGAFFFAGSAGAASIPPTAECSETLTREMGKYLKSGGLDGSKARMKKANNRFVNNLAKADCVSDAESLRKWVKPRPFSEQCGEASAAADAFIAPRTRKLNELDRRYKARERKLDARVAKLGKRARQLRRTGASQKRINAVERRQVKLMFKSLALAMRNLENGFRIVEPQAAATALSVFELISLRCIGGRKYLDVIGNGKKVDQPAARILRKHRKVINYSVAALVFGDSDTAAATASSAGNSIEPLGSFLAAGVGPVATLLPAP